VLGYDIGSYIQCVNVAIEIIRVRIKNFNDDASRIIKLNDVIVTHLLLKYIEHSLYTHFNLNFTIIIIINN